MIFDNNRTIYWKAKFLMGEKNDDRMKEHMGTVNGKYEDNGFSMTSMEQTSKIYFQYHVRIRFPERVI